MVRCLVTTALVAVAALSSSPAGANGRPPATNGVYFRPNNTQSIYVRSTFGLLVSHDDGCTFRWICEKSVGYGGTFDPTYAVAADGTLFATTFEGLRVSRDGGCSFATATAELPVGSPGRVAEKWVDALDIGPSGDVWIATADSTTTNDIFRSTDNGVTFTPSGVLSPMILWKSIKTAPSDPLRLYASGFEYGAASDASSTASPRFVTTTDGGQSWTSSPLTGLQYGFTPLIVVAAVDAADPQLLFVLTRESAGRGDRLYRSTDAGMSFVEVLATVNPINSVVIVDPATVLVASAADGTYRSSDGGVTFQPVTGPQLGCLGKRSDGTLIGCAANWEPDFMAVGRAASGLEWQKIFRFVELAGPLACDAGTPGRDVCDQELWPELNQQFGVKGPACGAVADLPVDGKPKGGGCCDAGVGAPGALASFVVVFLARRRRARKTTTNDASAPGATSPRSMFTAVDDLPNLGCTFMDAH